MNETVFEKIKKMTIDELADYIRSLEIDEDITSAMCTENCKYFPRCSQMDDCVYCETQYGEHELYVDYLNSKWSDMEE